MKTYSSLDVAKAAIKVSMTGSRTEEEEVVRELKEQGIHATAVDIGGNLIQSIPKLLNARSLQHVKLMSQRNHLF